jgi:uroporphyrinogen decarboxylase
MNKRERVLAAINHQETDYVPYGFHGVPAVWDKVCQHYGCKDHHEAMAFVGNHIVKIGSDFNYNPWAAETGEVELTPSGGPVRTDQDDADQLHTDEFGCVWDRRAGLPHPVAYPLQDVPPDKLDRVLAEYVMPDPLRAGRFDAARQLADQYRGDLFVFGKLGMCLFERAWSIRGMDRILIDMVERPAFVETLLDRILYEWDLPIIEQQLAIGVDGFYFAEDWGSETSLLFSPRMWRRFIKPRLAIMYQRCLNAGVVIGQHSDGAIGPLFPHLVELGLQVFNPLSPTIMNPATYKAQWGDKLTFYGGIDVERLMPFGTPDEVRSEVRRMAAVMGRGGGYILQSSHTVLEDTPLANIIAYIETVRDMAGLENGEKS